MYTITDLVRESSCTDTLEAYTILDTIGISLPKWSMWDSETFQEVVRLVKEYKHPPNSKVGADPEFEVLSDTGGAVSAGDYISGGLHSQVGTDGVSGSATGEIRPSPGSPEYVTESVRKLLERVKRELPPNYKIRAGAGVNRPLG